MIRSLTIGLPLGMEASNYCSDALARVLGQAERHFDREHLNVDTRRIVLPPAGPDFEIEGALASRLSAVEQLSSDSGIRWYCLPVDLVTDGPCRIRCSDVPALMSSHPRLFVNFILARAGLVASRAVPHAAEAIFRVSRLTRHGYDCFRVGASFNCPPNTPFFPASHHGHEGAAFSLALETVPLLRAAIERSGGHRIEAILSAFTASLSAALARIDEIGQSIEADTDVAYLGLDASLAPKPRSNMSVGALVSQLAEVPVGGQGTMFVTALLTDCIRRALHDSQARHVGFNGVMYSVLEDEALATAIDQRTLTISGLISLASVCGCGLDMLPISANTFPDEVAPLMLDLAALSSVQEKPLMIRLVHVPSAPSGGRTSFNQDFLCNSRVVDVPPFSMAPALSESDSLLQSRHNQLWVREE